MSNIAAAFMALGIQMDHDRFKAALDHWDAGCLELIEQLVAYAPYAFNLVAAGYAFTGDCAGVPLYEIAEEFGAWFGDQVLERDEPGMAPDEAVCRAKLRNLTFEFFRKGSAKINETDLIVHLAMVAP